MTTVRIFLISALILLLSIGLVFVVSCDDTPTGPGTSRDYTVYFNANYAGRAYPRYHTVSGLIDSVLFPYSSRQCLAVSPDGSRIYLGDFAYISIVTADSQKIIDRLQYEVSGQGIAFSADGLYVGIAEKNGLHILSSTDHTLLYSYPGEFHFAHFSADGRSLYSILTDSANAIFRLNLDASGYTHELFKPAPSGRPYKILTSNDQRVWYLLYLLGDFQSQFIVYNVDSDSILYSQVLVPGWGDMVMTPNGKYVFYSNPGTIFNPPSPNTRLTAFNVRENRVERVIAVEQYLENPDHGVLLGSLALTPDGKYLIGLSGPIGFEFAVIDARTLDFVDYTLFSYTTSLGGVVCQGRR